MFLGRIDGEKRIELLLQAMQQLKRDDIQLVVAGRGRLEGKLHQLSTDLELGDRCASLVIYQKLTCLAC